MLVVTQQAAARTESRVQMEEKVPHREAVLYFSVRTFRELQVQTRQGRSVWIERPSAKDGGKKPSGFTDDAHYEQKLR